MILFNMITTGKTHCHNETKRFGHITCFTLLSLYEILLSIVSSIEKRSDHDLFALTTNAIIFEINLIGAMQR